MPPAAAPTSSSPRSSASAEPQRLHPCNTELVGRRFAGQASAALAVVALCGAGLTGSARPAAAPTGPAAYLALAEQGLAMTQRAFWNPKLHWYDWRLTKAVKPRPLASLWEVFPLFELVDAVAIASPTQAHKAAVEAIGKGAASYLDPN